MVSSEFCTAIEYWPVRHLARAVDIDAKLGTQSAGLLFGELQRIRIYSRSQKERPRKNQDL